VPTNQYSSTECGHIYEPVQSYSDDSLTVCPECDGRLRKVFNAVGVVFKGSGFYRTDSRASATASEAGSTKTESKPGTTSDATSTTKSETKPADAATAADRRGSSPAHRAVRYAERPVPTVVSALPS
jgi:putative FmdB family regulatory protein